MPCSASPMSARFQNVYRLHVSGIDCGWSLLSHGVAEKTRLDLGNLNPIYERELNKPDVHYHG